MNKLTAAYLAGIIDGEGSIGFRKMNVKKCVDGISLQPRLRISMCDKEFMSWLKNSFGGGFHTRPGYKTKYGINGKESYCWSLYGKQMKEFLYKVYPYLRIKKKHAEIVMKFWKTLRKYDWIENKKPRNDGYRNKAIMKYHNELKPEIRIEREGLYQQLKLLQIKGKNAAVEETERENPMGMRQSDTLGIKQEITL